MKTPPSPERQQRRDKPDMAADEDKPDTNEVQHEPDPNAEPIPGAPGVDQKWHPKSPYTTGNY